MKSGRSIPALILTAALMLAAAPALAQTLTADRVLFALDLTDRRIEQAQNVASASADARAEVEVALAQSVQARARAAFDAGRLGMALNLTLEARTHADRAIAMVKGLPDPDRVTVQVERTREILDRARQRIEECENRRALSLMDVAGQMQQRAEGALAASRYLAAIELTMGARDRAFRAMRLCNLEDSLRGSGELALRRTDDVLSRARDAVAAVNGEEGRQALGEATDLQSRAQSEFRAEHFEPSLRLTQAARAMAHRAIRLSHGR